jgi:hypothetical protein
MTAGISTAAAASVAPSAAVGAIGHDASTPQCGRTLPENGAFGVVGVNGGRAFTENPCCSTSFTGAAAQMVQFVDGSGLDANYVCRRA